jgi:CRISPR-associated protein Csd2
MPTPSSSAVAPIAHRYDFLYFFDVADGNPNGDPDAGNLPRIDPETNQGLITDVCLKRKVRNFVALAHGGKPPHEIFVREGAVLNNSIERAYEMSAEVRSAVKAHEEFKAGKGKKKGDGAKRPDVEPEDLARLWLCHNFFDIRTFGAVLTTGEEKEFDADGVKAKIRMTAGQVRGPVQFSFARSLDPVVSAEHSVTRCAVTNEADREKERTMGRKFTIPYGLYCAKGYISAPLAAQTGFSNADLDLFKTALNQMFEHDRSAARGAMAPRRCIAFRHESALGNARADQLFARVRAEMKPEVAKTGRPPRSFNDYLIAANESELPKGISVEHWV